MFITREAHKSPVSALFSNRGELVWSVAELALQQIWFLAHLEEVDPKDGDRNGNLRTMILFDFGNVEHLLNAPQDATVRLKSVHIVTPGHINGSDHWEMEKLQAVWQGREMIEEHEFPTDIFETVSGKKYSFSHCSNSAAELDGDTLKFRLPH
ncbi:MAG: hypothetical protein EAZ11_00790 [Curvibacter sp.]|nr:MAG: hypothetical protein EAZ11_00790 [Curvibacter sp.]